MALTLNILAMGHEPGSEGVIDVIWMASDIVDGQYYRRFGTSTFTPNPANPSFVPFNELTEAVVVQWILPTLDRVAMQLLSEKVGSQTPTATPMVYAKPW
jgi:hypothetical protein